jgi:2-polyprenyl-3-methyl-5-hydroxy-6-metoxy-1,4-benzoquinol methylase
MSDRQYGVGGVWTVNRCLSGTCGVFWLDPAPAPADLHLAYADYYTHGEATTGASSPLRDVYVSAQDAHLADRLGYPFSGAGVRRRATGALLRAWPGRAAYAESLVLHLPAHPGGKALDVGCGSGNLVAELRKRGWDAEGMDVDSNAVEAARARGLPVRLGHFDTTDIPDETFDAVTLRHVVEHVHDPGKLLGECLRVLRPGGRMVIVTPNAGSLLLRTYGRDWIGFDLPRHLIVFTRTALDGLVSAAGFVTERSVTAVTGANVAAVAARALRRSGRHDIRRRAPLGERVRAELVQLWVALRMRRDAGLGEEIVVVATRPVPV